MNRKTASLISVVISILLLLPWALPAAKAVSATPDDINGYYNDILSFICEETSAANTDSFVREILPKGAAGIYDWFAFALIRSGSDCDFTNYKDALYKNAKENTLAGAVEKERFALLLASLNDNSGYINEVLDTCTGKLGIMSYVYALHLMNNGYSCTTVTKEAVISHLLMLRSQEAGWSLTGKGSDVDVTAMVIQSLAPLCNSDSEVQSAVDSAINWLSSQQAENGGFLSYGTENAESSAQVIIALCSIGISPLTDSRFEKNGNNPVNALLSYRLNDGSFAHTSESGYNSKATEQALLALVALNRLNNGQSPLYIFDGIVDTENEPTSSLPEGQEKKTDSTTGNRGEEKYTESIPLQSSTVLCKNEIQSDENLSFTESSQQTETVTQSTKNNTSQNNPTVETEISNPNKGTASSPLPAFMTALSKGRTAVLISVILLLTISAIMGIILAKKKNKASNIFFVLSALLLLGCVLLLTDFKSADEYYNVTDIPAGESTVTVTLSISCETVKEHASENEYIPDNGIILGNTEITVTDGSTVYDCLVYAAKKYGIHLENDAQTGTASTAYIAGLNYLYEFDYGELSGWMYRVNGHIGSVGCGEQTVNNGDKIEWLYTCNLGDDLLN